MDAKAFSAAITSLERRTAELQTEIRRKSDDLSIHTYVAKALRGLKTSWRDTDPGAGGQHWFFVKRYALLPDASYGHFATLDRCERFWAREVLRNPDAAAQGVPMARPHGGPLERKAPPPLGSFDEAKKEPCRNCGTDAMIVGCYERTEEGVDGPVSEGPGEDVWEIHLYALCLACPTLHPVAKRVSTQRLTHLLSWPAS